MCGVFDILHPFLIGCRLCHNIIGPHNSEFNQLWDQLRDEYTTLKIRGYTGEGFLSEGKRLGGRRIPLDEARRLARTNAEKRRSLYAGSGQKLGGTPVRRGEDIRKIIADAAQRRIEVTRGCASETDQSSKLVDEVSRNGFRTKAEEEDANEQAIIQAYIELIQEEEREKYGDAYIPPSQELPAGPRTNLSPPPIPESTKPRLSMPSHPSSTPQDSNLASDNTSYNAPWTCAICTLENPAAYLCCDACTTERPLPLSMRSSSDSSSKGKAAERPGPKPIRRNTIKSSPTDKLLRPRGNATEMLAALEKERENRSKRPLGWLCHQCGAFMESQWWTCSSCGTMKQVS